MKKIICLILAAVLCLSVFTSCEQVEGFLVNLTVGPEENAALDEALKSISESYKDLAGTHDKDFEVMGNVVIDGVKYPITWTADSDKVSIRESVKLGYYTIDIPSNAESDIEFTLTATISSNNSKGKRVKEFTITVLSAESAKRLSIADAISLGNKQSHDKYTEDKYYVSGTVGEFYEGGTAYGNFYISDDEGNQILIYGTYDVNGRRYDAMANKPVKGDKITVYGIVGKYNDAPQLKNVTVISINGIEQTPSADKVILSFADTANRVSHDTGSQVWSSNGITFTNNKASSTTNVADYSNPIRCYKNSSITVEYNGMKTVEFVCANSSYDNYASYLCTALKNAGYSATVSGTIVTVVFSEAANSLTANLTEGQVRISSIEISTN